MYASSDALPKDVSSIVLGLCQRSEAINSDDADNLFETVTDEDLPPTWPDGPRKRIDDDFREVSLKWDAMHPLIDSLPDLASEALLAMLIEAPTSHDHWSPLDDDLGIEDIREWSFPIFFHGPFRYFLWKQPIVGIAMVVRFINFATDRWEEKVISRGYLSDKVTYRYGENERELTGNHDVYHWYRDHMISSHSVPSVLMALEKCLYERIERKQPIDDWTDYIFAHSTSVALLAVLNALGCRYPELYKGPLKPLLNVWKFYEWEHIFVSTSANQLTQGLSLSLSSSHGKVVFEVVKEWYEMPHRRKSVYQVVLERQFTDPAFCSIIDDARERWNRELLAKEEQDPQGDTRWLKKLIDELNPTNYVLKEHGDGFLIEFNESDEDRSIRESALERSRKGLRTLSFPGKCRRLLNGKEQLSAEQIEEFWDEFQAIIADLQRNSDTKPLHRIDDIICGGIAVLICLHSDWVNERSERLEWCNSEINRVIEQPPPFESLESMISKFDGHWDSFLADIAVSRWVSDPSNDANRSLVASIALSLRYVTVGYLYRAASRSRYQLGDDIKSLETLIVVWASIRQIWNKSRQFEDYWKNVDLWNMRLVKAFVLSKLPTTTPSWERLANASKRQVTRNLLRVAPEKPSPHLIPR